MRLVLQPLVATIFAVRSGLRDAREGRPVFFWTLAMDASQRRHLLRHLWQDVGKLFLVAIVLDVVYQIIVMILKMASLLSIHTCSLAAPILLEEAKAAGVQPTPKKAWATPVCDKMKAVGQWNTAWDPFFELDPVWTEAFIAAGAPVYIGGVLSPKLAELLSIAFDASITHLYAPGMRRHIKAALKQGATMEEIMEVLKICVSEGVQASNMGVPILAEELERTPKV